MKTSNKTHKMPNKRINPFATAHSDRHKAAAVYAKPLGIQNGNLY